MQFASSFNALIGLIGLGLPQWVGNGFEGFHARIGACGVVDIRVVFAMAAQ